MSKLVWIPSELSYGMVETQMTYGAIVRYVKGGIEYHEMLAEDDYESIIGRETMEEDNDD